MHAHEMRAPHQKQRKCTDKHLEWQAFGAAIGSSPAITAVQPSPFCAG